MNRKNTPHIGPRQLVYENQFQHIYRVAADFGDFTKEYFVDDTGEKAGIVAVQEGSVLLVQQYRLLINGLSWEIPGGRVDEGEIPEAAAVRECLEETGLRCHNPQPLIFYHKGLDTTYNPTYIFHSQEVAGDPEPYRVHANEVSGHKWVPLSSCNDMIFGREIVDCFTIVALLAYQTQMNGL